MLLLVVMINAIYNGKDAHKQPVCRMCGFNNNIQAHSTWMDRIKERERDWERARWKTTEDDGRGTHTLPNISLVYVKRMNGTKRNGASNVSEQVNVGAAVIPTKIHRTNGFCYSSQTHIRLFAITDNRTLKWKCAFAVCNAHTLTQTEILFHPFARLLARSFAR